MKLLFVKHIALPLLLVMAGQLTAAVTPLFPDPTKSATPDQTKSTEKKKPANPLIQIPGKAQPTGEVDVKNVFTSPGVAILQNNQWVGSDHLYNLSNQLGLLIEISQPDSKQYRIDEIALKKNVENVLGKVGIQSRVPFLNSDFTPLPFLQFIVVVNSQATGLNVAYCGCRLFESVRLDRVHLDPNMTWQAITWESQTLSLTPPEQLQETVNKDLADLAVKFSERYSYYKLLKPNQAN